MGEIMLLSQFMTIEGILWRTIQDLFIERLRCLVSWFVTALSSMPWPKVSNEGAEVKVRCEVPRYANSTVLERDYQCQKLGLYGCCFCLGVVWVVQVAWIVWMMFVSLGLIWLLYVFVYYIDMFHCVFPSAKLTAAAAYWCWWYGKITKLLFYLPLRSETFPTDSWRASMFACFTNPAVAHVEIHESRFAKG